MDRYHRQTLLPQIGQTGQHRLARSRVLLVGCGALGTVIADQLARAGVGFLRICDRDIVELTNLQRQVLFDESDAADGLPKAIAAARRLQKINSTIAIDARVTDVHAGNIEELAQGIDLILDGTDNAETRYLTNDVAVKHSIAWVYGACVGTSGRVMGIVPGKTPCLRCVFPEPPGPGELPTCDTAGVLAPAAGMVASLQVAEAIHLLLGRQSDELVKVELWPTRITTTSTKDARRADCPTCGWRQFKFLDARPGAGVAVLCGRNTVQITSATPLNLDAIAPRLASIGTVQRTPYFIRCAVNQLSLTLFPDGRALIHGTSDPAAARSIYAKYVGS